MNFYTKDEQPANQTKTQNSFLDFVSKDTKNQIAWEMINNGADVNEVFQKIGFTLDDHLQLNKLKDPANCKVYSTSDERPDIPIPPAARWANL